MTRDADVDQVAEPDRFGEPRGGLAVLRRQVDGDPCAAVVLREVTRMVGVVPNAACRHFSDRDALLAAVRDEAVRELAGRMSARMDAVRAGARTATGARRAWRARCWPSSVRPSVDGLLRRLGNFDPGGCASRTK